MLDCRVFRNNRLGYVPLSCRAVTVDTRTLGGHGAANRQEFFFLTKPNTIRERATLDLLYAHPPWLVRTVQPLTTDTRVTSEGRTRVTSDGRTRVTVGA